MLFNNASFDIRLDDPSIYYLSAPSGFGKSTLLDILIGLQPVDPTSFLINDEPVHGVFGLLQGTVLLVDQQPVFINGTFSENLLLDQVNCSSDLVQQVLTTCCLSDFLDSLPAGLQTKISSSGSPLSAGQKQRLSLARALLRFPKLLLLDEATANIDSFTQRTIFTRILQQYKLPIIISSHDPQLRSLCSHLIEITNGKIILSKN